MPVPTPPPLPAPWAALDHVAEAVAVLGPDGAVAHANPAAARLLGELVAGDVLRPDGQPVAPGDLPAARTRRTGRPGAEAALGFPTAAGGRRWLRVSTRAPDPGQRPCVVVATFAEVPRRDHERALFAAERRFREVFDHSPIGMALVHLDGTFQQVNPAFAALVGRPAPALAGTRKADITHPQDRAPDHEQLERLIAGEIPRYRSEKRYLHALGHAVWVQVDATLVRDADGRPEFVLGQTQDISARRRHELELEHLADHDALTGLLNRRGFGRRLEEHAARAHRYGTGGALLMLDLDHFKYVNDTLGHRAGDELIVAVAGLLRARLRDTDVVARLGGDEFAIVLPEGDLAAAEQAAASILRALAHRPPVAGASALKLSASIGITALDADATAEELLVNADLAMYDAKEEGRGGWSRYAAGRHEAPRLQARMTWIDRIRAALDGDGLRLLAQPIFDAADGADAEPAAYELLIRMAGADGDLIPPEAFLGIAERFDLIQEIDRWVLERACELLGAARPDARPLRLHANVSGRSLGDPRTLDALEAALARTGADPAALTLEISETAAVTQIHHARAFAVRLRHLGVRLAIDDFGAGFGSFTALKHLPFDVLKIDGEFVRGAPASRPDALIVEAVRDLAHGLGRTVVAEHVDGEAVHAWLRAHDVDQVQGHHLGRPRPVADVLRERALRPG